VKIFKENFSISFIFDMIGDLINLFFDGNQHLVMPFLRVNLHLFDSYGYRYDIFVSFVQFGLVNQEYL